MALIISNFGNHGIFELFRYATITWLFLFRRGPLRRTWPLCRPNRFWQRPAKMRATTRNAWDSVWSLSHNQCQLFRLRRWVKLERKEYGSSKRYRTILFQFSRALRRVLLIANILFQVKLKRMEFFFSRFFSYFLLFFCLILFVINALINMVDAISIVAPWRLVELIQVFESTR